MRRFEPYHPSYIDLTHEFDAINQNGSDEMDREKVIDGINKILEETDEYDGVLWDAIALLKKQEAVKPKKENDGVQEPWTTWWFVCGNCNELLDLNDKYCRRCGKSVKWEET